MERVSRMTGLHSGGCAAQPSVPSRDDVRLAGPLTVTPIATTPHLPVPRGRDLTGSRYGWLVVLRYVGTDDRYRALWEVRCDCSAVESRSTRDIVGPQTAGCRACAGKRRAMNRTRHGDFVGRHKGQKSRLWRIWSSIHERCGGDVTKMQGWSCYHKKRIQVCDEWYDFETFRAWALANGYGDDLTIERKDAWGNYTPRNCEWITRAENSRRAARATAARRKWEAPFISWDEPHFPIEMLFGSCG